MAANPPVFVPCTGAPGVFELQTNGPDPIYGWVGYVLPAGDSTNQPIGTDDAFNNHKGSYLFAAARPTAGLGALQANVASFLQTIRTVPLRGLIWLPDATQPNPMPADSSRYAIAFALSQPGNFLITVQDFSAWLGPDNGFTFSVKLGSSVGWDSASQSITFSGNTGATAGFLYGTNKVWSPSPSASNAGMVVNTGPLGAAIVPLVGRRAGAFGLTATMEPAVTFAMLTPGFAFWANNGGTDVPSRFPLIDASTIGPSDSVTLAAAIDPLDLLNRNLPTSGPVTLDGGQLRTGFAINGAAPTWRSFFRNLDGRVVLLTACSGGSPGPYDGPPDFAGGFAFVAQRPLAATAGGSFQLIPCGDYGIGVDGVAAGTARQTLLPGLFGSERFNFTSWDPAHAEAGSRLRFRVSQPAYAPVFPFPDATIADPESGTVAPTRLTDIYQTSWAILVGPSPLFQAEPDGGAYYGGSPGTGVPLLGSTPPGTAITQPPGFFVPVAPYAAYAPDAGWGEAADIPSIVSAFESQILSATRKAAIGGGSSEARAARRVRRDVRLTRANSQSTDWTTTRQGLLAEIETTDNATDFSEIVLAQYQPRGTPPPPPPLAAFGFSGPTAELQEALQTSQLFVAAVNAAPLAGFSQVLDIADWEFLVDVGERCQPTDYSNLLILKYCDGPLIDWAKNPNKWTDPADFSLLANTDPSIGYTGLSAWLAGYLQDAIDRGEGTGPYAGKADPLYANIAAIATQADWKGFLALRASLPPDAALPPQIEGLAAGIDPSRFYAHHFGATLSRVKPATDSNNLPILIIDGVSSLFGLIDYQDPLYSAAIAAGSDPDTALLIDARDAFNFRVLNLQAMFVNAQMTSFQSRIQITLNQLFDTAVTETQRGDPAHPGQWLLQPGNGVVLDGNAVNQNGTTTYVFQQTRPSLFSFDTPALNAISISRVQFNTLGVAPHDWPSGSMPTITSRFLFWGAFDFPALEDKNGQACDLLSFGSGGGGNAVLGQGLAFANLQLTMRSPQATPTVTAFQFDPTNLAFDLGASFPRAASLFSSLALQLESFIAAPADKAPLDYGFLTVAPEQVNVGALSGPWCGIVHKVNMGGPGALVSAAGFSSQLLVAWSPVAGANPALFIGLSLPGTAPGASVFSLQGVFKITTGPISLQQASPGQFTIKLADVGATFLSIKKLPDATIQFFLFGDPQGTGSLGWYASWNDSNNQKQSTALTGKAAR